MLVEFDEDESDESEEGSEEEYEEESDNWTCLVEVWHNTESGSNFLNLNDIHENYVSKKYIELLFSTKQKRTEVLHSVLVNFTIN